MSQCIRSTLHTSRIPLSTCQVACAYENHHRAVASTLPRVTDGRNVLLDVGNSVLVKCDILQN